ncbi:MAG: hypothetical protein WKF89_01415 [Chitinophagaceae bacterium]
MSSLKETCIKFSAIPRSHFFSTIKTFMQEKRLTENTSPLPYDTVGVNGIFIIFNWVTGGYKPYNCGKFD